MAAFDRTDANRKMLAETEQKQNDTREVTGRIKAQLAETEVLANSTLQDLREQGSQMDNVNMDVIAVQHKLDQSSNLQDTFDAWSGSWFGGKKRAAKREATELSRQRVMEEMSNIREIFENQKFDRIRRVWKQKDMTMCSDPSVKAPELFDPELQTGPSAKWVVDYSLVGIDGEGWTYAYDFPSLNKSGAGSNAPSWNTYVRRRKWKMTERSGNAVVDGVKERNEARAAKAAPSTGPEKIGFVPRARVGGMKESGLSSTQSSKGKKGETLDDESRQGLERVKAKDAEIDNDLDEINAAIAGLGNIASQMRDEAVAQNRKLEMLDENMGRASDKQNVVNSRQKRYLS